MKKIRLDQMPEAQAFLKLCKKANWDVTEALRRHNEMVIGSRILNY